ncbi:TPA: TIM barrel protein [Klebsiella pneumoniae]|uniref:Xylose isomerase n=5 Tax=Enterobacteriaceae TaxID=543 RepID=A0A422ZS91_KLEPN|nr:TIM barrel protein [Klebsiella pneumoniae]AKR83381.1 xylose isomerase [Klebsiella pneumoniae DMC1097]EIV2294144.1 TIM barrel protein [Klebsiella pneumoniae]EJB8126721.1 TIM barrel protein [Klebsiella pneumoniae]EKK0516791.1 TIM barrel protein [Klebsiella pneumoniae]EKT9702417.1 TIM barrel protein [Klebsiella pneumoniae]
MLRSIATVSISGTLPEKLHAIAAAGYQGVEIFENDLLYYTGTPAEIRQLAADLGLKITLFQPFRDFEGASRAQFAANMARARRKFALMRELGCETLLLCSNVQPDCSADSELQVADLRALATLAEEEGIAIGYEALAWGTHVNRWQQAWERVRRVDSPALGLVLDSFHILARGDTLDALPSVPVEKITFVQLADAPYMKMDLLEWSRHFRCFPGQGELPLEAFAEQITRCGYRGPWSLEIFNDGFRASPNGATAKDGYRSLLWLEEQTRRRLPTCDADLFSPPPLPVYHGLEFIEFAASAAEAQRLGQHLQALGFQHEGSHRSRQVTLWRNGGARIVINHQPHSWADHFYQRHGVSLCAMALRVEQSASLVARARALGYATWLATERHMPWLKVGFFSILPFVAAAGGVMFGGWLSDKLLKATGSANLGRKLPIVAGLLMASCIITANWLESDLAVILVMSFAFFGQGMVGLGWTLISDIAPKGLGGLTGGLFNFCANLAGILTPLVIGFIVAGFGNFFYALIYIGGAALLGVVAYLFILGDVKRIELSQ